MPKATLRVTEDGWPMVEPIPPKETKLFAATITPGEAVLGQLVGDYNQTAVATNKRIIVLKSGFMVGATFGGLNTSFDYLNITAVEVRTTLAFGYFELTAGGMRLPNGRGIGAQTQQRELPNVISFTKSKRAEWDHFAGKVREMTHAAQAPSAGAWTSGGVESSIPKLLSQLAELHAAGVLTAEEFATKKAELLSRM
jgi:hypothetical protein